MRVCGIFITMLIGLSMQAHQAMEADGTLLESSLASSAGSVTTSYGSSTTNYGSSGGQRVPCTDAEDCNGNGSASGFRPTLFHPSGCSCQCRGGFGGPRCDKAPVGDKLTCDFGNEWVLPKDKMTDSSMREEILAAMGRGTKVCFCKDADAAAQPHHTAICRSDYTGAWSAQTALGREKLDEGNCFCMKGRRPTAAPTPAGQSFDVSHGSHGSFETPPPTPAAHPVDGSYGSRGSHGSWGHYPAPPPQMPPTPEFRGECWHPYCRSACLPFYYCLDPSRADANCANAPLDCELKCGGCTQHDVDVMRNHNSHSSSHTLGPSHSLPHSSGVEASGSYNSHSGSHTHVYSHSGSHMHVYSSYALDGSSYALDGSSYVLDGSSYALDGSSYAHDGSSYAHDGSSYDGQWHMVDGKWKWYSLGNEYALGFSHEMYDSNDYSYGSAHPGNHSSSHAPSFGLPYPTGVHANTSEYGSLEYSANHSSGYNGTDSGHSHYSYNHSASNSSGYNAGNDNNSTAHAAAAMPAKRLEANVLATLFVNSQVESTVPGGCGCGCDHDQKGRALFQVAMNIALQAAGTDYATQSTNLASHNYTTFTAAAAHTGKALHDYVLSPTAADSTPFKNNGLGGYNGCNSRNFANPASPTSAEFGAYWSGCGYDAQRFFREYTMSYLVALNHTITWFTTILATSEPTYEATMTAMSNGTAMSTSYATQVDACDQAAVNAKATTLANFMVSQSSSNTDGSPSPAKLAEFIVSQGESELRAAEDRLVDVGGTLTTGGTCPGRSKEAFVAPDHWGPDQALQAAQGTSKLYRHKGSPPTDAQKGATLFIAAMNIALAPAGTDYFTLHQRGWYNDSVKLGTALYRGVLSPTQFASSPYPNVCKGQSLGDAENISPYAFVNYWEMCRWEAKRLYESDYSTFRAQVVASTIAAINATTTGFDTYKTNTINDVKAAAGYDASASPAPTTVAANRIKLKDTIDAAISAQATWGASETALNSAIGPVCTATDTTTHAATAT